MEKPVYFKNIKDSSKRVKKGDIFVAVKGNNYDGNKYISEAILNGASFIISERKIKSFPSLQVENAKYELNKLLNYYYNKHSRLNLCAITGTDGKTTTSRIIHELLSKLASSIVIGTNGISYHKNEYKTQNTTPSKTCLYHALEDAYNRNIKFGQIEMSSEGILDNRGNFLSFNACIFTNITREHLNTHKTMKTYLDTKLLLFNQVKKDGLFVINHDSNHFKYIVNKCHGHLITYGIKGGNVQAKNIKYNINYTIFNLYYLDHYITQIKTSLVGEFNVYNTLAAIAYLYEIGFSIFDIKKELNDYIHIDGRFEMIVNNDNKYIVDFAHTPNGIYQTLKYINSIPHNKIIVILGAQGDKDKGKRPDMGLIGSKMSDILILTSEDPKNESLFSILYDLTSKIKKDYYITLSRLDAIKLGMRLMDNNDILIVFGKGNEQYEQIKSYRFKHNDMETIKKYLMLP